MAVSKRSNSLPTSDVSNVRMKTHFRITIMGGSCVGKSCIISQFLYNKFLHDYRETVEDLHRAKYKVEGRELVLDILDTAGAYSFPAMRDLAIASSDAFVLVYSVDDPSSFDEVSKLREHIMHSRETEEIPIVIVANKLDLVEQKVEAGRKTIEALVCVEWGNKYVEASAKNKVNIVGIFKEILKLLNVKCDFRRLTRQRSFSLPDSELGNFSSNKKLPRKKEKKKCSSVS